MDVLKIKTIECLAGRTGRWRNGQGGDSIFSPFLEYNNVRNSYQEIQEYNG
jgi:hypothetical protein